MGQIPSFLEPVVSSVIIFVVSIVVRRTFGEKALWYVWPAATVILTSFYFARAYYSAGPLNTVQVTVIVIYFLWIFAYASGMVVWLAILLGPRPKHAFLTEGSNSPLTARTGELEDQRGLTGIPRRYQDLLATYVRALDKLDKADRNPYPSLPRAFVIAARQSFTSVWEVREKVRQASPVPNVLTLDLSGGEAVLAELETLTAAQLAAIDECHRMNVRRLKERLISGRKWRHWITGVTSGLGLLVTIGKEVSGAKLSKLWPLIQGITLTGIDIPSSATRWVSFMVVMVLIRVHPD